MKAFTVTLMTSAMVLAAGAALAQPPAAGPARAGRGPVPATGSIAPVPADLKPPSLRESAIVCTDLAAQQKWYETVLGFQKVRDVSANEIVESLEPNNPDAVNLVLQKGNREPGAASYGRLIINVKDAPALVAFLQTHGVATQMALPNQAYFINDPEGNRIELYQPGVVQPSRGGRRG